VQLDGARRRPAGGILVRRGNDGDLLKVALKAGQQPTAQRALLNSGWACRSSDKCIDACRASEL